MAQLDVYRNANPATRDEIPHLLDLQSDLLDGLATRVVVPLLSAGHLAPISRLNPLLNIEGRDYLMLSQELAGVPRSALGTPVLSLTDRRQDILDAVDFLITGI